MPPVPADRDRQRLERRTERLFLGSRGDRQGDEGKPHIISELWRKWRKGPLDEVERFSVSLPSLHPHPRFLKKLLRSLRFQFKKLLDLREYGED